MKVVGIGLNRTGTTTLGLCFEHWGLSHISYDLEAFTFWRKGQIDKLLQKAAAWDSFEDWPWPLVYREMDAAFPGTKFVLTRRTSAQKWFDSLCRHADNIGPLSNMEEHVFGFDWPADHPREHMDYYQHHNEQARRYFADRPDDFVEVCWEEGDGWEDICGLVGRPIPNVPFPHANKSLSRPLRLARFLKRSMLGRGRQR